MHIKNESGRTMTEMLSVICITGLLGILGIETYQIAVKMYRANEILTELDRMSLYCSQAFTNENHTGDCDAKEMATDLAFVTIDSTFKDEDDNVMTTTISGLTPELGAELQKRMEKLGYISATEISDNEMTLSFRKDLLPWDGNETSSECSRKRKCADKNKYCKSGVCESCPYPKTVNEAQDGCKCPDIPGCATLTENCTCANV